MSGIEFVLDTNFILGLLQQNDRVMEIVANRNILAGSCAVSAITRMELLGFPGITVYEEQLIRERLAELRYAPLTREIENIVITIRRIRKIKLPDAIIAGTAYFHNAELLTLDRQLSSVASNLKQFLD
ncbi:type II toxin-antitoxin system VapC family toxin [Desulfovermiculus halophilus]|jgi:hypothetical protein|uniref:type II toxin-antitoxin system VapC family toxin n=1 Tax=Desulfovermiculus halophilus TaxID=339722 RepID=UPI0004827811|nr:type II toxin-antitoxin system VapC family toxin [Desulfovermiculus halophilus]